MPRMPRKKKPAAASADETPAVHRARGVARPLLGPVHTMHSREKRVKREAKREARIVKVKDDVEGECHTHTPKHACTVSVSNEVR